MASNESIMHIPAWKRLGLKLKSAPVGNSESTIAIAQLLPCAPENKTKRQRHQSEAKKGPPSKKVKPATPRKSNASPSLDSRPRALKKRKSVSFTPETKREDGDSIKQLFNAWVDQQKEEDPTFATRKSIAAFNTPEAPKVMETVHDTKLTESEKRIKRVEKPAKVMKFKKAKRSKEATSPSVPLTPTRRSPALSYLRQYHVSRGTWKFNKNHQNFLIKHMFDISHIPLDHTDLLHHYVTGMQGKVRTRLRDEALKIKIQDLEAGVEAFPPDMPDAAEKQQAYLIALAEYVATINESESNPPAGYEERIVKRMDHPAVQQRIGKRMRAERLLTQLSREPGTGEFAAGDGMAGRSEGKGAAGDGDSQKRMRLNDGSSQKKVRRRKARTTLEASDDDDDDDETSSDGTSDSGEESSSESDSPSSDSDESSEDGGAALRAVEGEEDSTSSSSTSSDAEGGGSTSDDDDDDDDEDDDE